MIPRLMALLAVSLLIFSGCGAPLPPPDPYNLAESKDSLGRGLFWSERGCYKEASHFFQKGLESARLSDNVSLIIKAQNSLGAAALADGDKNLAANYLEEALNIASGHPEQPELDKVLGNLGALAFAIGQNQDAEAFWQQAAEAAEERGLVAVSYYCDLARLYLATGRQEDFFQMVAKVSPVVPTLKPDQAVTADALNLVGQDAWLKNDLAGAEDYFKKALEIDRKLENTSGLAQDTEFLGLLMAQLQRPSEAAGYLDRSFFLWLALGRDQNADRVLQNLERLAREHKYPKNINPYLAARRNPDSYRLVNQCP